LLAGFRSIVDEAHRRLAERGHPNLRPVHGFTLQAVGPGSTASEVARRLGVSKQAAAKTVDRLSEMGYVTTSADGSDARRKLIVPTSRGRDMLRRSAEVFDEIYREWGELIGSDLLDDMHDGLGRIAGERTFRFDHAAWLG